MPRKTWTEKEVEFLRASYPHMSKEDLVKALCREWEAVRGKASEIGVKRDRWTFSSPLLRGEVPEVDKAYVVGLLEGEGYIGIANHGGHGKYHEIQAQISIANTNLTLLKEAQKVLGGSINQMKRYKAHWKTAWRFNLLGLHAVGETLKALKTYFRAKRKQCDLVIEFCESRLRSIGKRYSPRDYELFDEVKKLNHRGITQTPL
jgi:hypothetical protein